LSVKPMNSNLQSGETRPMEKLEFEREGLYAALDSISSFVVIEDENYNIQFMNKATRELFRDRKGEKCYERFAGRKEPCPVCPIEEILKKGRKEFVYYPETLGRIYESHASPFRNPDGTFSIIQVLTDITKREEAEEALKESEERFKNFFENANDAIFLIDIKNDLLLDANKEAERLTGYQREEIIGMHLSELYPPQKAKYYEEKFNLHTKKEQPGGFESEVLVKDGKIVPVYISANLLKFPNEEVILGIFRDISGYKKAEDKITEERNKLATILANIGEGVNIVRSDYTVKYQNKFLLHRFGDLIGDKCYNGFTDSRYPCKGCPIKSTIENNSTQSLEQRARDGRHYELILAPLENPDGSVDALEVVRDITEKKKVQEQIAFLAGIVDHASESVIATDQNGKILYVNPATEKMYEYTKEELIGKELEIINAELYQERIQKEIYAAALCGEVWQGELLNRRKDGKVFYTSTSVSKMVDKNGDFIALVWFQRDITQRKRYQEEMIRIEKEKAETSRILHENEAAINRSLSRTKRELLEKNLELERRTFELEAEKKRLKEAYAKLNQMQNQLLQSEKLASLGQLAAGVAHELNNPIGFVNSNLGTLAEYIKDVKKLLAKYEKMERIVKEDKSKEKLSKEIEELKEQINLDFLLEDFDKVISESQDGTQRVKSIVENLRDFSHVGKGELEFANINKGIESTLNIVWNELKYKAEVIKEYGDIPLIECLPQQLNQVFMNLLVNAAQAIATHGQIKIKTYRKDKNIIIEISDTGVGIPKENIPRIFEPFFTTKEVGKGTGLGLSVAYGIIRKHNGRIEVESEVNKGTTFRVVLPGTRSGIRKERFSRANHEKIMPANKI
jgi:two-component system NtrC family sensor kinase